MGELSCSCLQYLSSLFLLVFSQVSFLMKNLYWGQNISFLISGIALNKNVWDKERQDHLGDSIKGYPSSTNQYFKLFLWCSGCFCISGKCIIVRFLDVWALYILWKGRKMIIKWSVGKERPAWCSDLDINYSNWLVTMEIKDLKIDPLKIIWSHVKTAGLRFNHSSLHYSLESSV